MRLEQAAGADAGEIGQQGIVLGLVLDAAEQRTKGRVVFDDHGRAAAALVVHHQIHAVARQDIGQFLLAQFLVDLGDAEQLQLVEHILHHLVQVGRELDRILDLLAQRESDLLQLMREQRLDHLAPQRRQAFVLEPLQRPRLIEKARDFLAQRLLGLIDLGAALLGQRARLALGQRVALVAQQREHEVAVLAVEREMARVGKRVKRGKGLGLLGLVGLLDVLALSPEVRPIQALRDLALQRLDQLRHQLPKQPPLAAGQAQRARTLGCVEVVQIAQVRRHRPARRLLLHFRLQQRGAATAHVAEDKQVVVRLRHGQAEMSRRMGPLLTDPGHG